MTMPDRDSKPATIKTILVLDDDVLVRRSVVQLLRECGYRVLEAASTDEGIAILEKTAIPVDVVLSEIVIPGSMNGVGFAQWARSIRPELKILLAGTPERTVKNAAMWGWPDAEEALRAQARAGSYQAASGRSGAAGPRVTAAAVVWAFSTLWPLGSLRPFKLLQRSPRCSRDRP
jgi:CheY-like chemotaxis protein